MQTEVECSVFSQDPRHSYGRQPGKRPVADAPPLRTDAAGAPVRPHRVRGYGDATLFRLSAPFDPGRPELECFVRKIFLAQYGARVNHFLHTLLALPDSGCPTAVLGFSHGSGELFVEQYLDRPVERILATYAGTTVQRERVVEVGNLAAVSIGGARALITTLTAYLQGLGQDWVVFTAGPILRNSFTRMGIELHELADARPERLRHGACAWGRYYDQQPKVLAGKVSRGFDTLERRWGLQCSKGDSLTLWREAYEAGRARRVAVAA